EEGGADAGAWQARGQEGPGGLTGDPGGGVASRHFYVLQRPLKASDGGDAKAAIFRTPPREGDRHEPDQATSRYGPSARRGGRRLRRSRRLRDLRRRVCRGQLAA